ncbi:hypothetical protein RHGRI_014875 [Rhododendron griersonianum]|uniref:Uncharacterized protein n=1 Tax=Rhododendron griersonianum TaxID=479676 RepID=A0AAV6KB65_9ERIC|nr:hypothetical protein RHGRI_014875 [Rhododendron griersonianum]
MNAVSNTNDFTQENTEGSDSDSNADELPEYYQPISSGEDVSDPADSDHDDSGFHRLANGYAQGLGNEICSIDLSDGEEEGQNNEGKGGEEEAASESEIVRAFREDESRRNAPLPPEAAARVVEAMRGVSFSGLAPDWANQVPENQWINQLRGLRNNSEERC